VLWAGLGCIWQDAPRRAENIATARRK